MILINQEIISSVKSNTIVSIRDYSPGEGIHYGLIILVELAGKYYSGGCELTYICQKYNLHLYIVASIIQELKETKLIDCRMDNPNWLSLKEEPHREWIFEVVSTLKGIFYSNNFNDDL